jgi:Family of unknown function (DUF6502)
MKHDATSLLAAAVTRLLRPLIKLLLRNGIAYGTFAELTRKVYVDVGFDDFKGSSKRPSVSSVAALTGLTRKEVKRLRELKSPNSVIEDQRYNRSVRVISGWLNDPSYLKDDGTPETLVMEGHSHSFSALVKQYSGDIPSSAMLSVLEAAKCVKQSEGHVELLQHAYIPEGDPEDKINILGTDVAELIGTIDHNITSDPGQLRFQRKVSNIRVNSASVPQFRRLSAQKAQQLLEELDIWLSDHELPEHELSEHETESSTHYVAMGIYYTERPCLPDRQEK